MIRTHAFLRSTAAAASRSPVTTVVARRTYYQMPTLANVNLSQGIPGLYSTQQLNVAWTQTQEHAMTQLHARLDGVVQRSAGDAELQNQATALAQKSVDDLVELSKQSPQMDKAVSYYAGLLYNNEFFFHGLRSQSATAEAPIARASRADLYNHIDISPSVEINPIPSFAEEAPAIGAGLSSSYYSGYMETGYNVNNFQRQIILSFGSVIGFKENLLAHAEAMFGDGYTWLVRLPRLNTLHILNTYGAGAPSVAIRSSNNQTSDNKLPGNVVTEVAPLLCINNSQRAYLHDYGVFGKRAYLENVWNTIDWDVVNARFKKSTTKPKSS